jgi:threonine/homoserine/homoserine lactone efflux protein
MSPIDLGAQEAATILLFMITAKLFVFLSAALLLAIAPGPGMLYVLARSLAGGKREGALSALGTFVGGMVHVFAAAAGVSVILARSAAAFAAVKYAGAAYLCFLGIRMILEAHRDAGQYTDEASTYATLARRGPFWRGVTT